MATDRNPTLTGWWKCPYRFLERLGETPRRLDTLCGDPARKEWHGVTEPGGTVTPVPFPEAPLVLQAALGFEAADAHEFVREHVLVARLEVRSVRDGVVEVRSAVTAGGRTWHNPPPPV